MNISNATVIEQEFLNLKRTLKSKQLTRPTSSKALMIYALHTSLLFGGALAFFKSKSKTMQTFALLISSYGALGVATAAHTASHFSTTENRKLDKFFTYLGFTTFLGVSEKFWRDKHVVKHHLHPNNVELDGDFQLMPFFAAKASEYEQVKDRLYYQHQYPIFIAALSLNAFNVQRNSWQYLLSIKNFKTADFYIDLLCLLIHFVLWIVIPGQIFGYRSALRFYLFRNILLGYAMFAAFAPAHFPHEAKLFEKDMQQLSFLQRQLYTTINFKTGFFGWLVCNGVEFQIEHHLMPNVNPLMYKKIQPYIKKFCAEHQLPYYETSWYDAIKKSLYIFKEPKQVFKVADVFNV